MKTALSGRRLAIPALVGAIVIALFISWRLIFYGAALSGLFSVDAFPLINDVETALHLARSHPAAAFFVHGACGVIAMITGALQFIFILRKSEARWHRALGRLYAFASIIASATACVLAWSLAIKLLITSIVYTFGGLAWGGATIMAVWAAMTGDTSKHVRWIIRSYVYLLMVVTARAIFGLIMITQGVHAKVYSWWLVPYAVVIVATFIINLILAEWIAGKLCPVQAGMRLPLMRSAFKAIT